MSIFNILDDVYDVESPMEKIMSVAKKKKDKPVAAEEKKKKTDPFLDGFNMFANEEKKEKSHLDSVNSGGKSKNAYIMPQGSWWRKLSGENEVQKAAGENAARKKQEQASREQSKAPVAKKKDPFLDGFNQSEEEEKKEKSHLDFVSSGGKSKAVDPKGKQLPWRDILTGKKEIAMFPGKSREEKLSGKEKRVDMYRKWEEMNGSPSQSPESQNQVKRKVWEGPIDYSKENKEIFNPEKNYEKFLNTLFDGKPRSFKLIDKNGKEKPADIKFNSKGEPEAVKLSKPKLLKGLVKFGKEAEAAIARGATPEELQELSKEKNPLEWENGTEHIVDEYGKVYELPRVDKSTANELKLNQPLQELENAFSIAEWIPGIDNLASLGSAITNVVQGDWGEAGLDLLGAVPLVNEVKNGAKFIDAAVDFGKGAKKAGKSLGLIDNVIDAGKAASKTSGKLDEIIDIGKAADKIDDANDFRKIVDRIDDTYDAAKAAKDSADIARKRLPKEVMTPSKPITSVTDNYELAKAYQSPNGNGMFGAKGENCRVYKSSDQYESAADFYARISRGGQETPLDNFKGIRSKFDDGSIVTYRVTTTTSDSPAVEIQLIANGKIQKIHFILED